MYRPRSCCFASDLMFFDQIEDHRWPISENPQKLWAVGFSERLSYFCRWMPDARIDQPNVAARASEADVFGFENSCAQPGLGGMKRRRQTREATTDDHHIDRVEIGLERSAVVFFLSRDIP